MKDVWKVLREVQDVWKDQEMHDVWEVHGKGEMLDMDMDTNTEVQQEV